MAPVTSSGSIPKTFHAESHDTSGSHTTIIIERLEKPSADAYYYALSAYRLLFAPRVSDPEVVATDLIEMNNTYLSPGCGGCFLFARDAVTQDIIGIIAFRPYVHRFTSSPAGDLRAELDLERIYPSEKKVVEVIRLFVSPRQRGKGLAKEMIEALVQQAREEGVGVMYLHTHTFLPGAEQLWTRMGWEVLIKDQDSWESIHMIRKI